MALPLTSVIRKVELWLWRLFFVVAIVFMVTWSLAQVLLWGYNQYSKDIENWLETQSGYDLAFSRSHNQMSGLNPLLSFSDLKIVNRKTKEPLARAKNLLIELNTLKSLIYLRPVFDEFVIDSLEVTVRQNEDLSWSLDGLTKDATDISDSDTPEIHRWVDLVLYQGNFDLRDALVHLYSKGQPLDRGVRLDVLVTKKGDDTQLEGEVHGERNPIDLVFRGNATHLPGEPDFNLDLFFEIEDLDSQDWAKSFQLTQDYRLDRIAAAVNVWVNWNYKGVNFVAETVVDDVSFSKLDESKQVTLETDSFYVAGEFSDVYCSIQVPSSTLKINNENYESSPHRVLCDYLGNWWWSTPELDLNKVNDLVTWLPDSFKKLKKDLTVLSPKGHLLFPVVWVNSDGEFRFESQLKDVAANAWEGAPGLDRLNGHIVVENTQGYVDLTAKSPTLSYPEVFRNTQTFDSLNGRVDWWLDNDNLRVFSRALSINSSQIDAQLGFAFEWEFPSDEARLGLDVSISKAQPGQLLEFLPNDLEPDLLRWMDESLPQARVENGRLLLTMSMDPAAPVTDTVMVQTNTSGDYLEYDKAWPGVDNFAGHFELNNHGMKASVSGSTLGNPLENLSVEFPNIWEPSANDLIIHLSSHSELPRYLRFVEQSPLQSTIGKALEGWTLDGEAQILGGFRFNLKTNDIADVDFDVFPQQALVGIPGLPEVSGVKGEISYSDKDELVLKHVSGNALGGPVSLSLETKQDAFQFKGRGKADVSALLDWQALPETMGNYLAGQVNYYFNGEVGEQGAYTVNVHSDLKGVTSKLPYPMTKEDKDKSQIFVYQAKSDSTQQVHSVDVGALNIDYEQQLKTGIERTVVSFGRLPKESRVPDQGIFLFARLSKLDIKAWAQLLDDVKPTSETSSAEDSENKLSVYADVMIQDATLGDMLLNDLSISCSSSYLGHRVALRSRQASGTIRLPRNASPVDIDLDYLILPKPESETSGKKSNKQPKKTVAANAPVLRKPSTAEDPLIDLDPAILPETKIKISRLQRGTQELGFWRAKLTRIKQGVRLEVEDSNLADIRTTGSLFWTKTNDRHSTFLDVSMETKRLKTVFKKLGYEPSLQAKSVDLGVFTYWQGSPAAFDRLTAQGVVDILVKDGQFLNVSNSASTLKVFGLFNLSSLSRRLKLDFSDVYSSGLAFDEISGRLSVNNGLVDIDKPVQITGPSANINLAGGTDLAKETLDMQMRLSVPVSGTLPLAVVVAGVNPLIGGIMLLGQGVWGGVVDQFTGVNYQITGTWSDPVMEATTKVDASIQ